MWINFLKDILLLKCYYIPAKKIIKNDVSKDHPILAKICFHDNSWYLCIVTCTAECKLKNIKWLLMGKQTC